MRQVIRIAKMHQQETAEGCVVSFDLEIKGNPYVLEYKITGDVKCVPERCDCVVINFLLLAMRFNMDIQSSYPMSEALYLNLTKQVIPQVHLCNPKDTHPIVLDVPTTNEKYNGDWRGTGISLGVDSLSTIHEYQEEELPKDYKLTHLVHMKTGAHHGLKGGFDKETENRLFDIENQNVIRYCHEFGFPLVNIETNLFEITCAEFVNTFADTVVMRNLGVLLLLQHKFDKYYYATTYNINEFKIDIKDDNAYYENWLVPLLSTENLTFFCANSSKTRIEKTEYISLFEDAPRYLHVCHREGDNCGECPKCIQTCIHLDLLGKLNQFKVFDVEKFYKNKKNLYATVSVLKNNNLYYNDAYNQMKHYGVKMPGLFSKIKVIVATTFARFKTYGFKFVLEAIKRKIRK